MRARMRSHRTARICTRLGPVAKERPPYKSRTISLLTIRGAEANSSLGPSSCPFSPECLEGEFSELRRDGVLRSSLHQGGVGAIQSPDLADRSLALLSR